MINALAEQFSHLQFPGVLPLNVLRIIAGLLYIVPVYIILTLFHHFLTSVVRHYILLKQDSNSIKLFSLPIQNLSWNTLPAIITLSLFITALYFLPFGQYFQGIQSEHSLMITIAVIFISGIFVSAAPSCHWFSKNSFSKQKPVFEMMLIFSVFIFTLIVPLLFLKTTDLAVITEQQTTPDIKRLPQWLIFTHPVCLVNLLILLVLMLQMVQLLFNECSPEKLASGNNCNYNWLDSIFIYLFTALITIIYLGGYHSPFHGLSNSLITIFWFQLKQFLLIWIIALIKYRLPDFSYKQQININFRILIPLSLFSVLMILLYQRGL